MCNVEIRRPSGAICSKKKWAEGIEAETKKAKRESYIQ
jgi:hypothetical protein